MTLSLLLIMATPFLILKLQMTEDAAYNGVVPSLCSVVENVNSQAMNFKVCSTKFRQSPELQELAVMTVWHIVANQLALFPLRDPSFF
jgi:hypothetical protein